MLDILKTLTYRLFRSTLSFLSLAVAVSCDRLLCYHLTWAPGKILFAESFPDTLLKISIFVMTENELFVELLRSLFKHRHFSIKMFISSEDFQLFHWIEYTSKAHWSFLRESCLHQYPSKQFLIRTHSMFSWLSEKAQAAASLPIARTFPNFYSFLSLCSERKQTRLHTREHFCYDRSII